MMMRLVQDARTRRELAATLPIVGAKLEYQAIRHRHSVRVGAYGAVELVVGVDESVGAGAVEPVEGGLEVTDELADGSPLLAAAVWLPLDGVLLEAAVVVGWLAEDLALLVVGVRTWDGFGCDGLAGGDVGIALCSVDSDVVAGQQAVLGLGAGGRIPIGKAE
jgi:hypothetical protein